MYVNDGLLIRAVRNLLSNTIRYAESTVTISCRGRTIRIANDGPGIAYEDYPHHFYQGRGD